jgi:hypothetical protein
MLKCDKQKEGCIVVEGDILRIVERRAFKNAKLNDRRRINGSTVIRRLGARSARPSALRLLKDRQLIPETSTALGISIGQNGPVVG